MFVCEQCGERSEQARLCARDGSALVETDDPFLGAEVGRYRLVRLLGRGGMGRVYAAIQPELGSRVAIKVLSDEASERPELVERFFNEARAVNLIRHEGIVNVIDLMQLSTGRPVIVMELVDGRTLREIVRAGPVPLGGVIQVMIEVLQALAAAHAIGIVHRDLKPDNILVTNSGRAKVLDFGVAKLATNLQGDAHPTKTGALLGTPHYMSPEQIGGGTVDARADIYAAGIVLYEAVTGHLPFEGLGAFDLMRAHLEQPPPSPRHLRPDLPYPIEQVIMCALAKQRGERFTTANAMANALHEAAATLSADQWRALTSDARMFPRSFTPPAPIERQITAPTGPMPGHTPATQYDRPVNMVTPATQPGHLPTPPTQPGHLPTPPTHRDRPGIPSILGPELAPILEPTPTPMMPPRRRRVPIIAAVVAAALGAGIAAIVMVATREVQHASPVAVAGDAAVVGPATDAAPSPIVIATVTPPDAAVVTTQPSRRPPSTPASTSLGPNAIVTPLVGDPSHFDPTAFMATAESLAEKLIPTPQLMLMHLGPVFPDGHVDLRVAVDNKSRFFVFRTPTPEATRTPDGLLCQVVVAVYDTQVVVAGKRDVACKQPSPPPRHCSIADAWDRIVGKTKWTTRGAIVTWNANGWDFDARPTGEVGGQRVLGADSCGQHTVVTVVPGTHPGRDGHSFYLDYDGDKTRFDGFAYLPTALALAQKLEPDVRLDEIELRPIASTGFALFDKVPGQDPVFSFHFYSPARAAGPAHDQRGDDGILRHLRGCEVFVQIENKGALVTVQTLDVTECVDRTERMPRCSLQRLWAKALAQGVKPDQPAWIHYQYGKWEFTGEVGDDRKYFKLADDC